MLKTRIDFVAPPFAGHLFPLLHLAQQLRDEGFETQQFCSTPEAKTAVELCGFTLVPFLQGTSQVVFQISDTNERVGSNPFRLLRQLRMNLSLMDQFREELRQHWMVSRPDLVIADMTVPVAGLLAQAMGIRWWTSIPTPCALETLDGTPSYLGGWLPRNDRFGQARDALGRIVIRAFKRTMFQLFKTRMQRLGIERVYQSNGFETIYSHDTVLALGVREFELPRSWPHWLVFTGPLINSPPFPSQPPDFIDGRRHVLVSLGTHLWWAKDRVRQLMQEVATKMPEHVFHFTMGRSEEGGQRSIVGNFHTYDYIPYDRTMHRYQLAIHHGGTGVTYSCLRNGIPSLSWPQDYDQFDHTARLVHHGLGLRCRPQVDAIVEDLLRLETDNSIHTNVRRMEAAIQRHCAADIVRERLR